MLDLQLPTIDTKTNPLTEVLQPAYSELLLTSNKALTNTVMIIWSSPSLAPTVSRRMARCHRPASGDLTFVTQHPNPEGLEVQAATGKVNPNKFPSAPPDVELKLTDAFKKGSSLSLIWFCVPQCCLSAGMLRPCQLGYGQGDLAKGRGRLLPALILCP